jgi:hypothetical protein
MGPVLWPLARVATVATAVALLSACEPLSIMAAGVGGSAAVSHTLGGITYRTFTASASEVRAASINALNRMGLKVTGTEKGENGAQILKAVGNDREIEITFEPISTATTRMRVIARNGSIFFDSATATEIILQTEKRLTRA